MSKKNLGLGTLLAFVLGLGAVQAQGPSSYSSTGAPTAGAGTGTTSGTVSCPPLGLSQWMVGTTCDCCGPTGGRPMGAELFFRTGVALTGGDGIMADSVKSGWLVEGGHRLIFFNDPADAGWLLTTSLSNVHNSGENPAPRINLLNVRITDPVLQGQRTIPSANVELRSLNRTFVTLGLGRLWYLSGDGMKNCERCSRNWRIGLDAGGRWGTAKAEFAELRHFTDTIAGIYAAGFTDLEFPIGCCMLQTGLRIEWDYTWSDILQIQNKSDLTGVNLLWSIGLRY